MGSIHDDMNVHSCDDCRRVKFQITNLPSNIPLSFSYKEVLTYKENGCDFFARALREPKLREMPKSLQKDAELQMSLILHNDGPNFHDSYIRWTHPTEDLEDSELEDLHAFTEKDTPLARYISSRPCELFVFHQETKTNVKRWLDRCQESHTFCNNVTKALPFAERPTRLIAIGSETMHLEEMNTTNANNYVVLSYCWGDGSEGEWHTDHQNYEDYQKFIEHDTLPQTIKDAVNITRELGYGYLWVDALCIIQRGNENDKTTEMQKMTSIYLGASVVLSAARARDSREGFLQNRRLDKIYNTVFEVHAEVKGKGKGKGKRTHAFFLHESTENSKDDPIEERAWTLQEHRLAVRLLRFGSKQTRWSCLQEDRNIDGGCACFETTIDPIAFTGRLSRRLLDDNEIPDEWRFNNWMHVVEEYCSRKLSNPSDRLPALAALAYMFAIEQKHPVTNNYYAGLWAEDLPMQLLWRRVDLEDCGKAERIENSNPSWSWASIVGNVQYPYPPHARERITLRYIDCQIVLKDQNLPFGEVQSAKLTLDGNLREANWDGHVLCTVPLGVRHNTLARALMPVFDEPAKRLPGLVWLLHVYSSPSNCGYGLILENDKNGSVFKRIGYFEADLDSLGANWLQLHDQRKITII
ncbi:hypothetical protein CJF32_00006104 [Rutstroemia sp. NJR-2017a WRK4]|nr:hypothetical protein CJF32_00006104 [Rutstroemia sp. NJR-2017a WRK4]